jgi:glycerophosphoryl diester phosphodiesterase
MRTTLGTLGRLGRLGTLGNPTTAVVALALTSWLASCSTPAPTAMTRPPFDLQGHRGARGLAPENTLAAFDKAMDLGVNTLELDIGVTRDGVAVIAHDPKLNPNLTRDAQGKWLDTTGPAIVSLTLTQVQSHDVGRLKPDTRYAQTYAQQQPRDGERIPTLLALFDRVQTRRAQHVRFNIETKLTPDEPSATVDVPTFVRVLLADVDAKGLRDRVTVQSFDWRTLRETKRVAPMIETACLTVQQSWMDNLSSGRWTAGITLGEHGGLPPRMVKAAGCEVWSPYFGDVTEPLLAEARRLKLVVVPWTVNAPADIERLLDLKVDGLISDYPDRVRSAMQRRGMPLPPSVPSLAP